jgi:hypothetical protein
VSLTLVAAAVLLAPATGQVADQRQPALRIVEPHPSAETAAPLEENLSAIRSDSPSLITAGTYAFASSSGVPLEDMSTGATGLIGSDQDDAASPVTAIGFDFYFDGVRFTQFSVNSNGLCRLGGAVVGSSGVNTDFATTAITPKVAPYYDNLWIGANGTVRFKVVGAEPVRKLVVEWSNMQVPRVGAGTAGAGTFQVWLFETTGIIEFVYGSGMAANSANGGYSVGLQSGSGSNFVSVTTAGPSVSYGTPNNTQITAIAAGTAYAFTPNIPNDPTNLMFSGVTALTTTLTWADNADNEAGYAIYRSTDGVNFSFVAQTPANTNSKGFSGLTPDTPYVWRVYAVSEGALSNAVSGSQPTPPPGSRHAISSGLWSDSATWSGGAVPIETDDVTIDGSVTVTIDTDALAWTLTIQSGGTLQFEATTARTLTVGTSVSIASGGQFTSSATGTQTDHVLSIGGNLLNDGTLDFSTNGNAAGAAITFTGASNATFSGSGPTTDLRTLTLDKGATTSSMLELMPAAFSVRGATTDAAGFLVQNNGTLKISGTFSMTNRVFNRANSSIPASGGIWLDNPNFIVAGTATGTSTFNDGLVRVTTGTYNIGVNSGDALRGGTFIVEGGTVNASGRLVPGSYTQSGGTVNVATVGNNGFQVGSFQASASFTMSGGTINLVNPNSSPTPVDYAVLAPTTNITGGLLVIGAAGAPPGSSYHVQGSAPNFTVNATMTLIVTTNASVVAPLSLRGTTIVNNGTIASSTVSGSTPRFDFASASPMTYGGAGAFGSLATPFRGDGISTNSTALVTLMAPIVCMRVNLFQGGFVNSNQITLGNGGTGGASTTFVQIGGPGISTAGGSFDISPAHNQGTGGEVLMYLNEGATRTTGFEINPARMLHSMTMDNPNNLVLAGGDLTLFGSAGNILNLYSGRIITGANTFILSGATGTVAQSQGRVDGNYRKIYDAPGFKPFEVGTANGKSRVDVNLTAGSFPAPVTVSARQGPFPGFGSPQRALQRYWIVTAPGIMADLTFHYLDPPDVPATANENAFVLFKYDGALSNTGGLVDPAANQAALTTSLSSVTAWSLAEPTTLVFTDNPLTAGTTIKAAHVNELRTAIDAVRYRYGLGPYGYSDTVAAGSVIKASDILQMRLALKDAYDLALLSPPTYTTTPAVGATVRIADIMDLRAAVANIY